MKKIGNINLGDLPLLPAAMEDVSDPSFRAVCKENGADPMYTEFISSEGLKRDVVRSREETMTVAARARYGMDGIMIGRAAIGYPRLFNEIRHFIRTGEHLPPPTVLERVRVCKKHLHHSIAWKRDVVGILEMRRHYTNYKGLPHIKDFRQQLVTCKTQAVTERS